MPAAKTPSRSQARSKRAPARKAKPPALSDALAEAAWREADKALAEALALSEEIPTAKTKTRRRDLLDLLEQALSRVARRRGLSRIGELGAREKFDPTRHDFDSVRAPKMVRVLARGVARGEDVLVKARAGPLRAKRT